MPADPRVNPAGEFPNIAALIRRVADLEDQVRQVRERNYGRRAWISSYTAGSATMWVTFEQGGTALCRWIVNNGYTPAFGHWGFVLCTPEWNWWLGQDSVP